METGYECIPSANLFHLSFVTVRTIGSITWLLISLLLGYSLVHTSAVAGEPVGERDHDHDGLIDEDELERGTDPNDPDTAGDGLLDGWEVLGYTRFGQQEDLGGYGADPLVKDIFVEIDWMESRVEGVDDQLGPSKNAVIAYQTAIDIYRLFESKSLLSCQRDSESEIRIHFDLGPDIESLIPAELLEEGGPDFSKFETTKDPAKVIPYQDHFPPRPSCNRSESRRSLYDVYNDARYFRPARRNVFYYVVIAEQVLDARNQTIAADLSDSFVDEDARQTGLKPAGVQVAVTYRLPRSTIADPRLARYDHSVSVLHELGHALGLGHGGATPDNRWDNRNHKPNYPSIMNYQYQFPGIDLDGESIPVMDFSHGRFIPIIETGLDESHGLGLELPNPHILSLLSDDVLGIEVTHIEDGNHPENLDWNGNGLVDATPVERDLDRNGALDSKFFTDHDDWREFVCNGFSGIGPRAFDGCGLSCGLGHEIIRLPGDFNGDGITDVILFTGNDIAVAYGSSTGSLNIHRDKVFVKKIGTTWTLSYADQIVVGDFDGDRSDEIFLHRRTRGQLVDLDQEGADILWFGEEITPVEDAPPGADDWVAPADWRLDDHDQVRTIQLHDEVREALLTINFERAGVSRWQESDLRLDWESPAPLREITGEESPTLFAGRSRADGTGTLFLRGVASLFEFDGLARPDPVRRIDAAGVVPSRSPDGPGWPLSSADCFYPMDLDGDGNDEVFVKGSDRIGVLRDFADGLFLVWQADRDTAPWRIGPDDSFTHGPFLPGGGDEIVFFYAESAGSDVSWRALEWNPTNSALESVAVATNTIEDATRGIKWGLRASQRVFPGNFVPGGPRLLLVQSRTQLLLVRLTENAFTPVKIFDGRVGGWTLSFDDRLIVENMDGDAEDEVMVKRETKMAVLQLGDESEASFIGDYNSQSHEFETVPLFRRGDSNGDNRLDLSDSLTLLTFLFRGGRTTECPDGADTDDNGRLELSDAIRLLNYLFLGDAPPPLPGPEDPGTDPTPDALPLCRVDEG